jgi:hypothetical protein
VFLGGRGRDGQQEQQGGEGPPEARHH